VGAVPDRVQVARLGGDERFWMAALVMARRRRQARAGAASLRAERLHPEKVISGFDKPKLVADFIETAVLQAVSFERPR
jgi:hypothetical protein